MIGCRSGPLFFRVRGDGAPRIACPSCVADDLARGMLKLQLEQQQGELLNKRGSASDIHGGDLDDVRIRERLRPLQLTCAAILFPASPAPDLLAASCVLLTRECLT